MKQNTNCNTSIKCSVNNCAHHNSTGDCCSLQNIRIGCCGCEPTCCEGTECASFQLNKVQ